MENIFKISLFLLTLLFIFSKPAYAYLDPGTGSYIIQVIIGALLGGGYLIKLYWNEIKAKFQQLFKKDSTRHDQQAV